MSPFVRTTLIVAVAVLAIATITILVREVRPARLDPPDPTEASDIEDQLIGQTVITPPANPSVLRFLFRYPDRAGDWGELTVGIDAASTLPRRGSLTTTASVLATPGRYLSVRDETGDFVHAVFLGERFRVLSEHAISGELNAELGNPIGPDGRDWAGGVVSARLPFSTEGVIQIFEVQGGEVSRVFLQLPLEKKAFPTRGRSYRVPFS